MNLDDNWRLIHFSDGEIRSIAKSDDLWAVSTAGNLAPSAVPISFSVTTTAGLTITAGTTLALSSTGAASLASPALITITGSGNLNPNVWIKGTGGTNAGVRLESTGSVDVITANGFTVSEAGGQAITIVNARTIGTGILLRSSTGSNLILDTSLFGAGSSTSGTISLTSSGWLFLSTALQNTMSLQSGGLLQLQSLNNVATPGGAVILECATSATPGSVRIGNTGVATFDVVKIHNEIVNLEGGANGDYVSRSAGVWTHVTPAFTSSTLTSAHILVGSAGNVATDVAMTGDVTITNAGVTAIGALKVVNSMIAAATIDLAAKVTGTLPVANGGTGQSALTIHTLHVGNGTTAVTQLAIGTNGQLLIGQTTADPAFTTVSGDVTITSTGATTIGALKVVNGMIAAATIDLVAKVTGILPVANGGTGLAALTIHTLHVGNGTSPVTQLAIGTGGQLLIGQTTADPAFTTVSGDITITNTGVTAIGALKVTNAMIAAATIDLAAKVTGTLPVANGGTGLATLTAHSLQVGNGTTAITQTAVGTNGQILVGQTTADPLFKTLSGDISAITAAGAVTLASIGSAGSIGSESLVPVLTFDAQGRETVRSSAQVMGTEVQYGEFTGNVTVAATTSATATQLVAVASGTYAARRYKFEFSAVDVVYTAAGEVAVELWDNTAAVALGILHLSFAKSAGEVFPIATCTRFITVAAGTRVYSVKAWNVSGAANNGIVEAGAGGAGVRYPGFLRISLA